MIKLARTLTGVIVILAAIGTFGGIVIHSGRLVARNRGTNGRPKRRIPGSASRSSRSTASLFPA